MVGMALRELHHIYASMNGGSRSILVFHAQRLGKYPIDYDRDRFLLSSNPVFFYLEVHR
jgi:hypothetical protein